MNKIKLNALENKMKNVETITANEIFSWGLVGKK